MLYCSWHSQVEYSVLIVHLFRCSESMPLRSINSALYLLIDKVFGVAYCFNSEIDNKLPYTQLAKQIVDLQLIIKQRMNMYPLLSLALYFLHLQHLLTCKLIMPDKLIYFLFNLDFCLQKVGYHLLLNNCSFTFYCTGDTISGWFWPQPFCYLIYFGWRYDKSR